MGISGLLPVLRNIIEPRHVSKYAGKKVAVDTYSWLHKGSYGCALELCTGAPTDKYVTYCLDRVKMLLHYKVIPVMVFDGANLPSKQGTEVDRKLSRLENRSKGIQALRADNRSAAIEFFQRAVDVTPAMAHKLIKALRKLNVECIVAPYEADAQLAYLNLQGYVSAIISEDSDIIAFGAKAVLLKMDKDGYGEEYRQKLLGACSTMNLSGWEPERFTQMCIFAGCDYLKSLPGMGIKKAYAAINNIGGQRAPLEECFVRAINKLRLDGTPVPSDYLKDFERAYLTFQYQRVFDPETQMLVTLKPLPAVPDFVVVNLNLNVCKQDEDFSSCDFIGPDLSAEIAQAIATGDMNPCTHEWFEEAAVMSSKQEASLVEEVPRIGTQDGTSAEKAEENGEDPPQDEQQTLASEKANSNKSAPGVQADASSCVIFKARASTGCGGSAFSTAKVGKFQSSLMNFVSVSEQAKKTFVPPRRRMDADGGIDGAAGDTKLKRRLDPEESMLDGDGFRGRFKTRNIFCADSKPITSKFFKGQESLSECNKDQEVDGEGETEFSRQTSPAALSEDVTAKIQALQYNPSVRYMSPMVTLHRNSVGVSSRMTLKPVLPSHKKSLSVETLTSFALEKKTSNATLP